jgi:hypothetical protein
MAAELLPQVLDGSLSAHAAAKKMGWRKERTALDDLRAAWKRASDEERQRFLAEVLVLLDSSHTSPHASLTTLNIVV